MRVLLTHPSLRRPGGVQSFTRHLARVLTGLGHEVRGFSHGLESEKEPCCPELPEVTVPGDFHPDILHLQHHIPACAALLAFPGVPAVFHCHGGKWKDRPFRHPRIRHYLAVSTSQAERLRVELCLEPGQVSVQLNAVDTARFRPCPPSSETTSSLLLYHGRIAADDPVVKAITLAARQRGAGVDSFGWGFGSAVISPESMLPLYPVVFASGTSALEAMSCGCAVIVIGAGGCGEMVGTANFDRLRARNFSIPLNCPPATATTVAQALDSHDPADAALVCGRVRREADIHSATLGLVDCYQKIVHAHDTSVPDPRGESLAFANFLRGLAPMVHFANCAGPMTAEAGRRER